ncbi:MAG: hypothetical protein JXQ25_07225 [Deltaproteobacteria bacterium]|nr:hypothetical protein [Deltaproteobacteria bacterium]
MKMSWECPHRDKERCKKRNKPCKPMSPGCVMKGKARMLGEGKEGEKGGAETK